MERWREARREGRKRQERVAGMERGGVRKRREGERLRDSACRKRPSSASSQPVAGGARRQD
eukprot:669448-Pyramimonas_sp.AAC.1